MRNFQVECGTGDIVKANGAKGLRAFAQSLSTAGLGGLLTTLNSVPLGF